MFQFLFKKKDPEMPPTPPVLATQKTKDRVASVQVLGSFRRNVFKAGRHGVKTKKILPRQWIRIKIHMALHPEFLEELESQAYEMAVMEGHVVEGQEVDWDKIFEFIEKLLELLSKYFSFI